MDKEDRVQLVGYCNNCGTVTVTTNTVEICVLCNAEVSEIGWVEENNG
jgi:uncharacterized OB-fold protein